jgi:hypothetical protein
MWHQNTQKIHCLQLNQEWLLLIKPIAWCYMSSFDEYDCTSSVNQQLHFNYSPFRRFVGVNLIIQS